MSFTDEDKQEIRTIVREEVHVQLRPIEVTFEEFRHDIGGILKDIRSYMEDNVGLRGRVEVLEADVSVLKSWRSLS